MIKAQLNQTAAIVRTYGFPRIGEFVQDLLELGIQWVTVVTPSEQDKNVTWPIVQKMDPRRVRMIEQRFEHGGQAWAQMLNVGLDFIEGNIKPDFILTVSNTVLLQAGHLERLYDRHVNAGVMVTGARFKGVGKDGQRVSLGEAYNHHYRNTLALYKGLAFRARDLPNRFDESFDGKGGMEDLAWKLDLQEARRYQIEENVVEVPLLVHTHRTPDEQRKYEATMMQGIGAVEYRHEWKHFRTP